MQPAPDLPALARTHQERWEWDAAGEAYQRALERSPDDPELLAAHARYLLMIGQFGPAIDRLERTLELDPDNAGHHALLGWAYLVARRYDDAGAPLRRALDLDPRPGTPAVGGLLALYHLQDRIPEPDSAPQAFRDDVRYRLVRARSDGEEVTRRLEAAFDRTRGTPAVTLAFEAAILTEQWPTFYEEAERWVQERRGSVLFLWLPQLDFQRFEPRFQDLMDRTGLPQ